MKVVTWAALLLLILSTFNVGWPRWIWSWKVSILSNQFGHFAILLCLALLFFSISSNEIKALERMFATSALLIAIALFSRATIGALKTIPNIQQQMVSEFGLLKSKHSWFSVRELFFGGLVRTSVPFERMVYAHRPTGDLTLDFYRPDGKKSVPWVMVIHGGGWDSGDSEQLPELNWELARMGYAVVSINYRLAPSSQWPAPFEDAGDALQFVEANAGKLGIDAHRWVVMGRSAGGQIAGVLAYRSGLNPPRGLISFYAPTDMSFGYDAGDEDDILASRGLMRAYMGGDPLKMPDQYHQASPLMLVSSGSCPTLLMHGKTDSLVWFKHSDRLYRVLKSAGRKAVVGFFDGGPHGFDYSLSGPDGQVAAAAVKEFLAQVL
jgi:acetyl esterase/lipase